MKTLLQLLPVIIAGLLLSAHFSRAGQDGLVLFVAGGLLLLLSRRQWVAIVIRILLWAGAVEWLWTAWKLVQFRMEHNQPWIRLLVILGVVALFTAFSSWTFRSDILRRRYSIHGKSAVVSASVFLFTFFALSIIQMKVLLTLLLLERVLPGMGWVEIFLLCIYGAWMAEKMHDVSRVSLWRRRLWGLFSAVFFIQLLMGLSGVEKCLMTGELHWPVPAMIVAGPIFRGDGYFMVILFTVTMLFVGSAWCSHLCYIGVWDDAMSRRRSRPQSLPSWQNRLRVAILILVVLTALGMRMLGASATLTTAAVILFAAVSLVIMAFWSRKSGIMSHCVAWCPIGLVADWLGRISPFRIRIGQECTECGLCERVCRYDALRPGEIRRRKPGITCTLCGDCLESCPSEQIQYQFLKWKGTTARSLFQVLVVSLHVICLGVARV